MRLSSRSLKSQSTACTSPAHCCWTTRWVQHLHAAQAGSGYIDMDCLLRQTGGLERQLLLAVPRLASACTWLPRCLAQTAALVCSQVRLGEVLKIWRAAGGGLQLEFENPQSAAQPSASARGGAGASQQHSTGSKRARRD